MQDVYLWMLEELRSAYPQTVKVPGRYGGYVRVAVEQNPEWYRQLCERHKQPRRRYPKPRTIIRRVHVLRVLESLASGVHLDGLYAERIRSVAADFYDVVMDQMQNMKSQAEHEAELATLPEF